MTATIHVPMKFDGLEVKDGIILIGEPTPIPGSNLMRCLANVYGALCLIEIRLTFGKPDPASAHPSHHRGRDDA